MKKPWKLGAVLLMLAVMSSTFTGCLSFGDDDDDDDDKVVVASPGT